MASEFTALERAVFAAICQRHSTYRAALEAQLSTATFRGRENSGAGFFTTFTVERNSTMALEGLRLREGPQAKIEGLQHGMGFILWLKEGYADCLEGYSYGVESTNRIILESVVFEIVSV